MGDEMSASDTPRTDALLDMRNLRWDQLGDFARQLETELTALRERLAAAEKGADLRHKLLCMTHADAMELWEALVVGAEAVDRIHDCVTGKPFASNDEVAYILNAAELTVKAIRDKHRQAYSSEPEKEDGICHACGQAIAWWMPVRNMTPTPQQAEAKMPEDAGIYTGVIESRYGSWVTNGKYQDLRTFCQQQAATIEQLRGEVAVTTRHHKESRDANRILAQAKEQAEARVKVLEAALEKIFDFTTGYDDVAGIVNKVAREALKEPTK